SIGVLGACPVQEPQAGQELDGQAHVVLHAVVVFLIGLQAGADGDLVRRDLREADVGADRRVGDFSANAVEDGKALQIGRFPFAAGDVYQRAVADAQVL